MQMKFMVALSTFADGRSFRSRPCMALVRDEISIVVENLISLLKHPSSMIIKIKITGIKVTFLSLTFAL